MLNNCSKIHFTLLLPDDESMLQPLQCVGYGEQSEPHLSVKTSSLANFAIDAVRFTHHVLRIESSLFYFTSRPLDNLQVARMFGRDLDTVISHDDGITDPGTKDLWHCDPTIDGEHHTGFEQSPVAIFQLGPFQRRVS